MKLLLPLLVVHTLYKLLHLILGVLLLLDLGVPLHHQLRLSVGDVVDAEKFGDRLLDNGKVRGELVLRVKGEWLVADDLELLCVDTGYGRSSGFNCCEEDA